MKISVLTASVRPEGLDIVYQCLKKQDFDPKDFEWVIVGNEEVCNFLDSETGDAPGYNLIYEADFRIKVVLERPKREGDFYNLTKSYNDLFKHASGELFVQWTDMTWAPTNVLTDFWKHYEKNPKGCVGGVGDQYEPGILGMGGEPIVNIWKDPRKRLDQGSFYEISPVDFEMCLASLPAEGVYAVGGMEEEFDRGAAIGEKCMCLRMDKLGYKFYLDQSIEYKALKHGRLNGTEEWNKAYEISCDLLAKYLPEINNGERIKLNYL